MAPMEWGYNGLYGTALASGGYQHRVRSVRLTHEAINIKTAALGCKCGQEGLASVGIVRLHFFIFITFPNFPNSINSLSPILI